MKDGLGNLTARGTGQLAAIVKNKLKRIQYRPELIDGFLAQIGLTLEPEPAWQSLALLPWFRRLRIRWEIRDDIHEAFLSLACAIICWRRLPNLSLC